MEPLFKNSFPSADKAAWLTQVQKELKNESAYEGLRWQTDEGFLVEPYYTAVDLTNLPLEISQQAQKADPGWLNAPNYQITDEKADNVVLRNALTQGAEALLLDLSASNINIVQLLNGIKLSVTPVFFRVNASTDTDLVTFIKSLQTVAPYSLKGGLLMDVSGTTAEVTQLTADSPQFRTVCISGHAFHNAGATATQELAFTLASLADTYDKLTDSGLTIEQLVPKTILSLSVGTSYFLEIAKLRALRILLLRFLIAYNPASSISTSSFSIHCQTSTFYDAAVTPYTNLLRVTTEAMAVIIGGCDVLTVRPYDAVVGVPDEFSERIARNVSILLKDESHLDKVADPSAGSYYVENLTNQLVETAWSLFLEVEKRGGLAMADEFIQSEIEQAYRAKVEAVRNGKVLVGVTKFRSDETTVEKQAVSSDNSWLPNHRLAEEFE
ncbi:methylmalonyl-CoA mutase family protein [Spirosoma validum]|uniref:Methylmalonyl-CoA mutase n=1 Tax=Spirosoma validum TaxID=2771355 RepID=A0A927GH36_9BACT|nr:methylmalonyl-CoA mutase family protein [Spirosoma validum]MBD2757526.1 methylmalonyl-CoA mutase [Spirosoma validum]